MVVTWLALRSNYPKCQTMKETVRSAVMKYQLQTVSDLQRKMYFFIWKKSFFISLFQSKLVCLWPGFCNYWNWKYFVISCQMISISVKKNLLFPESRPLFFSMYSLSIDSNAGNLIRNKWKQMNSGILGRMTVVLAKERILVLLVEILPTSSFIVAESGPKCMGRKV